MTPQCTAPQQHIPPKLGWREREVFGLLAANGPIWTAGPALARITLKFETLISRLRVRGFPIQSFSQTSGAKLYRLAPKPWPSPPPAPPAIKSHEISSATTTNLHPRPAYQTAKARKEQLMASHSPESLEAYATDKSNVRWIVFEQMCSCRQHGATTDEIAEALGLTPNQVSGRMLELKDDGFIVPLYDSGGKQVRRLTRNGCFASVYTARQFRKSPAQDDLFTDLPERLERRWLMTHAFRPLYRGTRRR